MQEKPEQPQEVQPVTNETVVAPKQSETIPTVQDGDEKIEESDFVRPDVEEKNQSIAETTNEVGETSEENAREEVVVLYPYIIAMGLLLMAVVMLAKKRKEENTHEE